MKQHILHMITGEIKNRIDLMNVSRFINNLHNVIVA